MRTCRLSTGSLSTLAAMATLATLATLTPGVAAAHCFMVFDPQQRLVYQSTEAPFDLSQPLSSGLAAHFPGHHLVMTDSSTHCAAVDLRTRAALSLPPMDPGTGGTGKSRLPRRGSTALPR